MVLRGLRGREPGRITPGFRNLPQENCDWRRDGKLRGERLRCRHLVSGRRILPGVHPIDEIGKWPSWESESPRNSDWPAAHGVPNRSRASK
jgi:hypothetical protein